MEDKAKRILSNNLFMTLATVDASGQPWSTPVFYAIDGKYNFYWYSRKDTRHSQNIKANNKSALSVYSSHGDEGGVYVEGIAVELSEDELGQATQFYSAKAARSDSEREQLNEVKDFLGDAPLRMYKLTPQKIYVSTQATKWNGKWIDKREEVIL